MRKLKFFTHCTLFATTPSVLAYPEYSSSQVMPKTVNWLGDWWWGTQEQITEWIRPTTYDEIMQMLDDLESGELERRYLPEQLERVNEYLATLAREGILPNEFDEETDLEEDSYDLLYGEDSGFQLARYLESSSDSRCGGGRRSILRKCSFSCSRSSSRCWCRIFRFRSF